MQLPAWVTIDNRIPFITKATILLPCDIEHVNLDVPLDPTVPTINFT